MTTLEQVLEAQELIKVKFIDFQDQKHTLADDIANRSRSELIAVIGNIAILYREHSDPEKRRIGLPSER